MPAPSKVAFPAEFKLIDESRVPERITKSTEDWIELLNRIPQGKALVTTEKELGVKGATVKIQVAKLIKKKMISPDYRVAQRTKKGQVTIYIIHGAKQEVKP